MVRNGLKDCRISQVSILTSQFCLKVSILSKGISSVKQTDDDSKKGGNSDGQFCDQNQTKKIVH